MDTASTARASATRILTYPYRMQGRIIVVGTAFFLVGGIALFSMSQTATFSNVPPYGGEILKLTAWAINLVWHVGLDEGTRIAFAGLATLCIAFALFALGTEIIARGAGPSLVVGPSTISISGRPWGNRTLAFADVASVKLGSVRSVRFLRIKPHSGRTMAITSSSLPSSDAFNEMCAAVEARLRKNNHLVISGASGRI
jgi:hypothetical protein